MSQLTDDYQEAIRRLEASKGDVARMVAVIKKAAYTLDRWHIATIQNVPGRFPQRLAMNSSIDAREWPAIETLAAALQEYHRSCEAAGKIWDGIPAENRVGLSRPNCEPQ